MQIKFICILCDTGGKVSYTFPSCVPVDFPASDANSAHSPLAEFCVPCVPSGTGGTLLSQPSHKTTQAPWLPPVGPVWPVSIPGGERPVPARSGGGLGHTGLSLAERKENSPARKAAASANEEYASVRLPIRHTGSPKTSSGERCEKRAGERPGVAGGVPCRVTSPGRAGR